MRKVLGGAVAAAVLALLFAGAQGSGALWRAQKQLAPAELTTGSLVLTAGDGVNDSSDYVFPMLNTTALAPGGRIHDSLVVGNGGDAALRYTLSAAGSGATSADAALIAALRISAGAARDCSAWTPHANDLLFNQGLSAAVGAHHRDLAPGVSERLCVRLELPANAPIAAAGGNLALRLTFVGEQR